MLVTPFTFAFIADTQIGFNSPAGLYNRDSDMSRLMGAIKYINKHDIDFVIFGGDQIDQWASHEEIDVFLKCLDCLKIKLVAIQY